MTIEQKQCLLRYLGYYAGAIDGIWGEASQQATISFQRAYEREQYAAMEAELADARAALEILGVSADEEVE